MHLMVAPEDTDLMHSQQSSREHITPQGNLVRHIEAAVLRSETHMGAPSRACRHATKLAQHSA